MEKALEQVVEISTDGTSLHGVYHQSRSEAKQGIVFCDPFAEEKKVCSPSDGGDCTSAGRLRVQLPAF